MASTATRTTRNRAVNIAGTTVAPGRRQLVEVLVSRLPTATRLNLPIMVLNGQQPGPRLWLSAVVHGDELNGLEIIRRVLELVRPRRLAGMLLAVPVVNVFGMVTETRYLPDRRDLNRSFPGSPKGSLAAQLADLHTGSDHRFNLPQIRGDLEDPTALRLARAFGAPVSVHSPLRDGSLREACRRRGIPVVVYEGGEADRFNETAISAGVDGVLRVLADLGMRTDDPPPPAAATTVVRHTHWVRARRTGILRSPVRAGQRVARGDVLGIIADAVGDSRATMKAPFDAVVIGHTQHPLVNRGDALWHLADLDPAAKGTAARLPRGR
jgi:predicted deacylase